MVASTAKVPLPCTGTQTCVASAPATASSCSRTSRLMAMKRLSREPQSRSIASLTVLEVVSGPGVSSQGSPFGALMRVSGSMSVGTNQVRILRQRETLLKSLFSIRYIDMLYILPTPAERGGDTAPTPRRRLAGIAAGACAHRLSRARRTR